MTTAHNFPELDLSPISIANSSRRMSLHDSSLQITLPVEIRSSEDIFSSSGNNVTNSRVLRSIAEESRMCVEENPEKSVDLEISLDSVGPQPTQEEFSLDNSSEELFHRMENQAQSALLTSRSSGNIAEEEEESDVSKTGGTCLRGVFVYVDFQCCVESAQSVRSKLRKMGAIVTRRLSATNTHVVFSRGGRKNTLQTVLSMENRPFLVDPHWVHACWFDQDRISEDNYNLYGCKYLLGMLQRRSSAVNENRPPGAGSFDCIELSPDDGLELTGKSHPQENIQRAFSSLSLSESTSELTFDQPMTATQLLSKIDKLSKRLDRLDVPGPASLDHGVRCVSRSSVHSQRLAAKSASTNTVSFTPVASKPLRRRSHGAFSLTHRLPGSSSVAMLEAFREEKCAESGIQDLTNRMKSINLNKGKVNGVDDMRKTTETDLNRIRKTLQSNSRYQKKKKGGDQTKPWAPPTPANRLRTVDESDESLLRTPRMPIRRPPVITASDYINRLQNIPSSDEFAGNRHSRVKKRQIVFTGVSKRDEKEMRMMANDLSLDVGSKVDHGTRCVVSGNGLRTLSTLRAIVLGVPVVKPEWLNACEREEKLVSSKNYVYQQWSRVIQQRDPKCSLFSRLGKILVVNGCSPPSEELTWMIRRSGGKMTTTPNESNLIVAPEFKEVTLPWDATDASPPLIVPERYILDCITENEVLCIADYSELSVSIR